MRTPFYRYPMMKVEPGPEFFVPETRIYLEAGSPSPGSTLVQRALTLDIPGTTRTRVYPGIPGIPGKSSGTWVYPASLDTGHAQDPGIPGGGTP